MGKRVARTPDKRQLPLGIPDLNAPGAWAAHLAELEWRNANPARGSAPTAKSVHEAWADERIRELERRRARVAKAIETRMATPHRHSAEIARLIRDRGLSDRGIAQRLGIDREGVGRERKRLGYTPAQVRAIRDGV